MNILGYDCFTAAGAGPKKLMQALMSGTDCSTLLPAFKEDGSSNPGRVCRLSEEWTGGGSFQQKLEHLAQQLWNSVWMQLHSTIQEDLEKSRCAFVFSSTKGFVEDYIWQKHLDIRQQPDPYSAVLQNFTQKNQPQSWILKCNMSNACSSSHVALEYIQDLFQQKRIDYAVLFCADLIGPFIAKGFGSLRALSPTQNKPFAENRDGLQLGDGAAMFVLSTRNEGLFQITGVASETEGSSITRPSMSGQGLFKAIQKINAQHSVQPDGIVAHGTGTRFNDLSEDMAFQKFFSEQCTVPITGTKWCIGHTLGASGAMDLIAACEILKNQKGFYLGNTPQKDSQLKMTYMTRNLDLPAQKWNQILVTSLGFGGVHAAMLVEKARMS